MTRLLIADDHPIILEGLATLFQGSDYTVVARCASGDEVMEALERAQPEILLLDVSMPAPGGLDILRRLKEGGHPAQIVLLTSSMDDVQILEAVRLGVDGLVLKESAPRRLTQCLDAVRAGDQWLDPQIARRAVDAAVLQQSVEAGPGARLTARELEVTRLVARGLRNKEIARELSITEGTVKMYLHTIYEKLDVGSRVELANVARERGWL